MNATPTPSDERVAELLKDATDEYNTAANGNDCEAGAFWGPMKDALRDLLARRNSQDALVADAERYRWLRNSSESIGRCMTKVWTQSKRRYVVYWREKLDAAVDAEIKAAKGEA